LGKPSTVMANEISQRAKRLARIALHVPGDIQWISLTFFQGSIRPQERLNNQSVDKMGNCCTNFRAA
jgi:hypothetical protein